MHFVFSATKICTVFFDDQLLSLQRVSPFFKAKSPSSTCQVSQHLACTGSGLDGTSAERSSRRTE